MTIEATLTRKLNISFLGARSLATEAKLQLGVHGYPSKEMQCRLVHLAEEIFHTKSNDIQQGMLRDRAIIDMAIEINKSSLSSSSRHSLSSSRHSVDLDSKSFHTTDRLIRNFQDCWKQKKKKKAHPSKPIVRTLYQKQTHEKREQKV